MNVGASRRSLLWGSVVGAVGAGALAAASAAGADATPTRPGRAEDAQSPATAVARRFRGARQAGVVEQPPAYAAFVALDLPVTATSDTLRRIFTVWTQDIERLVVGRPGLADLEPELAAVSASLTVTVGVGRRVADLAGATAPEWLAPLPGYRIDRLEDRWSGGDLLLQVCAASPTTVAHAVRRLTTAVASLATVRWIQRGFREPFEGPGVPMRNLLGQVDGTIQPALDGPDDALIWADDGPAWLQGGTGMVVRRIAMALDTWDAVDRRGREQAIGRRLSDGAPLTAPEGASAQTPPDLLATTGSGFTVIDRAAHVRRAQPAAPQERFLRRPYSYDDEGSGLLFVAFAADVLRQFHPVQQRLADLDLLNLWTTPVGSAVFAVLPGAREGEILGQALVT
ncbi:MAG: Dyp-type peroxidase [Phycicoccus sp.]|nr:Dyp-type peroxidase [Phycicoccus sp.]